MCDASEELDRAVLTLMSAVTSCSVRYRLREIHERLMDVLPVSEPDPSEGQAAH